MNDPSVAAGADAGAVSTSEAVSVPVRFVVLVDTWWVSSAPAASARAWWVPNATS